MLTKADIRRVQAQLDAADAAEGPIVTGDGPSPFDSPAKWLAFVAVQHRTEPVIDGLSERDLGQLLYTLLGITREAALCDAVLLTRLGFRELAKGVATAARQAKPRASSRPRRA
jgi:hypothetical protein